MKILHIYKDYFPVVGGIENYTRQLAEKMAARGHQVEVLVTNSTPRTIRETRAGVKVIKAGRLAKIASTPISLALPWELLKRLYGRERPDIIHLHSPYPVGETAWLLLSFLPHLKKHAPEVVLTYHSDVIRQKKLLKFYAPLLNLVLNRSTRIIATSPTYIQTSPFLRPRAEKCQVIPLGVEARRFQSIKKDLISRLRSQFALGPEEPMLLFVGRLRYYKGVQFLVEAMTLVNPPAKLVIVGTGPMDKTLKEQVRQKGLEGRIFFAGDAAEEELPGYFAACDIFILPSCERSEAYGIVQLEAMAAGKPLISTELGTGTSFVNKAGVTGLVVPPARPVELAGAINILLGDRSRGEEMGRRGQEVANNELSLEKMVDETEKLYIKLSSGKS